MRLVATEFQGGAETSTLWAPNKKQKGVVVRRSSHRSSLRSNLAAAFLPEGYPESTSDDYAAFQVWDSIQALCSYVRGVLTNRALLAGVGVGSQAATPLSAVFQFFVRDFSGMLGGIVFAFFQGSKLDVYAKQWRLFADCLNNVGLALELASPLFPPAFLLLACLGSIARAITGVAGGATRAALTLHMAKSGNAADIAAKEGSQETATTLIGILLGMALTRSCAESQALVWASFLVLTVLHVFSNVRAMRALRLSSLNPTRLDIVLWTFLQEDRFCTPREVAALEGLAPPPLAHACMVILGRQPIRIRLGAQISSLAASECSVGDLESEAEASSLVRCHGREVAVVLRAGTDLDLLRIYVHARLIADTWASSGKVDLAQSTADKWMDAKWEAFSGGLVSAGWSKEHLMLGQSQWRATWGKHVLAAPGKKTA